MPMCRRVALYHLHPMCEAFVGKTVASLTDAEAVVFQRLRDADNFLKEENGIVELGPFWYIEGITWDDGPT
jgi:hypothetical protein